MICLWVRRKMLTMSGRALARPASAWIRIHLERCPGCEAERRAWLALDHDLKVASSPSHPPVIDLDRVKTGHRTLASTGSLRRWLDWILIPEMTLRWGTVVVALLAIGLGATQFGGRGSSAATGAFPNDVVLYPDAVLIREHPDTGIRLTPGAVSFRPDFRSSDAGDSQSTGASI
ncbi:MAG: hypothetical protein FJY67_02095 [Calditrichaeota bacterium]|nr:hypothetical protein [Calditrichota bacterium]